MRILLINQGHTDNLGDRAISLTVKSFFKTAIIEEAPFIANEKGISLSELKNEEYNKKCSIVVKKGFFGRIKRKLIRIFNLNFVEENIKLQMAITGFLSKNRYDYAIIGGGELIKTPPHPFFNAMIYWCRELKKKHIPILVIGVSSDKAFLEIDKKKLKKALDLCEVVAVRDEYTFEYLRELGIQRLRYIPDIVFVYKCKIGKYDDYCEDVKNSISILTYSFDEMTEGKFRSRKEYYDTLILTYQKVSKGEKLFLIYSTYSDYIESKKFSEYLTSLSIENTLANINNLDDLIDVLRSCKILISGRMHPMILALQFGVNIIPIVVKHKISIFDQEWSECLNLDKKIQAILTSYNEVFNLEKLK